MDLTWITLLGGLCLFLYGLDVTRNNLEITSGKHLRDILGKLTENRLVAFATGLFITLVLQSSSASIAMLVGFVSSALVTLTQSMALILGADVGTTLAVQLIAFRVADYSLLIIVIGFLMVTLLNQKHKAYGKFTLGIGFIFLGVWQMGQAASAFKDSESLKLTLLLLKDHPMLSLFLAASATALLQSSAAFFGILLSLAHCGILPFHQALPMVIGANIGSCTLPFLVALKSTDRGRQVSYAHILLKISGVLLLLPFLGSFENLVTHTAVTASRQIAHAHFLFNFALSILFLPFINFGAILINKLAPLKPEAEVFGPKYLNRQVLTTPSFAFGQAKREVMRMAGIVQEMVEKLFIAFEKGSEHAFTEIEDSEDRSDILYREIRKYLVELSQQSSSEIQAAQQLELIILTSDLEHIGDTIDKSILPLIRIKMNKKLQLSQQGFSEIRDFHQKVVENYQLTISAFDTRDVELCRRVIRRKDQLRELELELRDKHSQRLSKGVKESIDTSAMHLELLSYLRQINSFISNIVYSILQKENGHI